MNEWLIVHNRYNAGPRWRHPDKQFSDSPWQIGMTKYFNSCINLYEATLNNDRISRKYLMGHANAFAGRASYVIAIESMFLCQTRSRISISDA